MGSPITLSGFNNIDFRSITNIIIQAERQPITQLESDKKSEQTKLTAYGSFSTALSELKSALEELSDSAAFTSLKATSSDATVLTASSTSTATKGTFTLDVVSLARPQVTSSAAGQFSDINATVFDGGAFSITQGGTTTNIDLAGVDSLAELRDAINSQQVGVRASIINDGTGSTPFRLVLTSVNPGVANSFTVTDTTSFAGGNGGEVLNLATDGTNGTAMDTEFTYNGITVKSTSTSVSEAIPGLTLNLFKIGTSTVTITDDSTSVKDKIKRAISAFNRFNDFFVNQTKLDTGSGRPPLANDPLLRSVNRQIRNYLLTDHPGAGGVKNLADLGITFDQSGKLKLDEGQLDDGLANKRADTSAFLSGPSGVATTLANLIKSYTSSGGSIDRIEDRMKNTIDKYSSRIQDLELRLAIREQQLNAEFAAADQAISQLNSQSSSLNGLSAQYRLF